MHAHLTPPDQAESGRHDLRRTLGTFDITMIVVGGMIGSGIFMNPYLAAREIRDPTLLLCVWALGGLIALAGARCYSQLAAARPHAGGQYSYLRDAYHPVVAYVYGWSLLVIAQSGGMAAVAMIFARYLAEAVGRDLPDGMVAATLLGLITIVNCLGARAWKSVQNTCTLIKSLLLLGFIVVGFLFVTAHPSFPEIPQSYAPDSLGLITALGAALIPVLFAFGGWQTACFLAGETRDPQRTLPRALLIGVGLVVALYLAMNYVCIRAMGTEVLARTPAPGAAVMRLAMGYWGATIIAVIIAISSAGFLAQNMLTVPRVYFAMADDGLFFRGVRWVHPRTGTPVVAVALQGAVAIIIALTGKYEQILTWVVPVDFLFYGLAASCLLIFSRRASSARFPPTAMLFIAACAFVVIVSLVRYPRDGAIGFGVALTGVPAYYVWRWRKAGGFTKRKEGHL
jgi:basic amino acid/polyamine antiporter, APA family